MLNWQPRAHRSSRHDRCVGRNAQRRDIKRDRAGSGSQSSFAGSMVKQVLLDPTTYAPSIIAYDATMRDWNTSQPFFRNGFMEHNSRYTISGRANDVPLAYADGKKRILADAAANLGMSALNNVTGRVFERMLIDRYPEHRKIVRAVSWIERISFGVYMSYMLSKDHYRQAELNATRAQQLGYR